MSIKKKILIIVAVIAVLAFGYWTISPFFIDKKVSEELPVQEMAEAKVVRAGEFTGFDRIHYGSGKVSIIKTDKGNIIRFEDDFNVANGPDLFVGLGKDGKYEKQLAKLKGNIGSQNYEVPADINLDDYTEVWIWCRAFSTPFAKAELGVIQ